MGVGYLLVISYAKYDRLLYAYIPPYDCLSWQLPLFGHDSASVLRKYLVSLFSFSSYKLALHTPEYKNIPILNIAVIH